MTPDEPLTGDVIAKRIRRMVLLTVACAVTWFLAGLAAGLFLFAGDDPEPTYCHSVTEDGPILDCDYVGETNTWEPR